MKKLPAKRKKEGEEEDYKKKKVNDEEEELEDETAQEKKVRLAQQYLKQLQEQSEYIVITHINTALTHCVTDMTHNA